MPRRTANANRAASEYLRVSEAATRLEVDRSSIYALIRSGRLRSVRLLSDDPAKGAIGIPRADFEEYLNSRPAVATPAVPAPAPRPRRRAQGRSHEADLAALEAMGVRL